MTITLPIRTTNPLNGSQGGFWYRAKIRRQQRFVTRVRVQAQLGGKDASEAILARANGIRIVLVRCAPSSGLDCDAVPAALKSIRDGVADAFGIDDRDPRIAWVYEQRRGKYAVEIRIEPGIKPAKQTDKS